MKTQVTKTRKLVESALMLAIAIVLGFIKVVELPYGGAVTIASMLPVIIIAYRHGFGWGMATGLAYSIIQQLLGLSAFSYGFTGMAIVMIVLFDYIIAFGVTGLGGIFRKLMKSQPLALTFGSLLVGVLRYICHVISGATVWAGLSIPTEAALIYSMIYNATYMLPETIVLMVVAYYIGSVLDFSNPELGRYQKKSGSARNMFSGLAIAVGVVVDVALVFAKLQNGETGEFDITGIANVNWVVFAVVTCVCVVAAVVFSILGKKKKA